VSALDAEMAFMRLADGRHMAGSHPLLGLIHLRWYESLWVTIFPLLLSLGIVIVVSGVGAIRRQSGSISKVGFAVILLSSIVYVACALVEMELALPLTRDSQYGAIVWVWRFALVGALVAMLGCALRFACASVHGGNWLRVASFMQLFATMAVLILSIYWALS
jgi:hypothetical protein